MNSESPNPTLAPLGRVPNMQLKRWLTVVLSSLLAIGVLLPTALFAQGPIPSQPDFALMDEEDGPIDIDVLGNDGDPAGDDTDFDHTTLHIEDQPDNGDVEVIIGGSDSFLRYTPYDDFSGADYIEYQVCETGGLVCTADTQVTIQVNNVNDEPVANPDTYSVGEGAVLMVPTLGVLDNDTDNDIPTPGDVLTASYVAGNGPYHGMLEGPEVDGSFIYTPTGNYNGTDTFDYEVSDGDATSQTTVTINVTPIDGDDPVTLNVTPDDDPIIIGNPNDLSGTFGVEMDTNWEPVTSILFRLTFDNCLVLDTANPSDPNLVDDWYTLNPDLDGHLLTKVISWGQDGTNQWVDVALVVDSSVNPYTFLELTGHMSSVVPLFSVLFNYDMINCPTTDTDHTASIDADFDFDFTSASGSYVDGDDSTDTITIPDTDDGVDLDFNEAPTAITLNPDSIDENEGADALVGTFTATDADDTSHSFSPSDACTSFGLVTAASVNGAGPIYPDNGAFTIPDGTNELRTAQDFDFEDPAHGPTYTICVEAEDDSGATYVQEVDVMINDVNEPQTNLLINGEESEEVMENMAVPGGGLLIGTLTVEDDAIGNTYTYQLLDNNDKFHITGDELFADVEFNFEDMASYTLNIKVTDGATEGHVLDDTITINIVDKPEAPASMTPDTLYALSGQSPETKIGEMLLHDDPDFDGTSNNIFSLVETTDSPATTVCTDPLQNHRFMIDENTGEVFDRNGNLNADRNYYICVRASDADDPSVFIDLEVLIMMRDTNDAPVAVDDFLDPDPNNPNNIIVVGNEFWQVDDVGELINLGPAEIDVRANDYDPDGDGTWVRRIRNIADTGPNCTDNCPTDNGGEASRTDNRARISYEAPATGSGTDTFEYRIRDNWGANSNWADVELTYVSSDLKGDCSGNGGLNAVDIQAFANEIWDDDQPPFGGDHVPWYLIHLAVDGDNNPYPGSPFGCEVDGVAPVSIGDLTCAIPAFFGGVVCTETPPIVDASSVRTTNISIASGLSVAAGNTLQVPVTLSGVEGNATGASFSVEFDATHFSFDGTDADGNGLPDGLALSLAEGVNAIAEYDAAASRLNVILYSVPSATLTDGDVAVLSLQASDGLTDSTSTIDLKGAQTASADGQSTSIDDASTTVSFDGVAGTTQLDNFLFLPVVQQ
ncbi:MAG: Ig-like domain-containing protein [Chloroflexota bacterium]